MLGRSGPERLPVNGPINDGVRVAQASRGHVERPCSHNAVAVMTTRGPEADEEEDASSLGGDSAQGDAKARPTHGRRRQPVHRFEQEFETFTTWVILRNASEVQLGVAHRVVPDLPVVFRPLAEPRRSHHTMMDEVMLDGRAARLRRDREDDRRCRDRIALRHGRACA